MGNVTETRLGHYETSFSRTRWICVVFADEVPELKRGVGQFGTVTRLSSSMILACTACRSERNCWRIFSGLYIFLLPAGAKSLASARWRIDNTADRTNRTSVNSARSSSDARLSCRVDVVYGRERFPVADCARRRKGALGDIASSNPDVLCAIGVRFAGTPRNKSLVRR